MYILIYDTLINYLLTYLLTKFQEFMYNVRYCPFTSAFGACNLLFFLDEKKIPLVFQTYKYPKRC